MQEKVRQNMMFCEFPGLCFNPQLSQKYRFVFNLNRLVPPDYLPLIKPCLIGFHSVQVQAEMAQEVELK